METSLDMLKSSTISEEDSRLVDSILNELNSNEKEPTHLTQPPQRPQQQPQAMQQQQQQAMQQQQQASNGRVPPPPNLTQEQFNNLPPEKKQMFLNHKQQYMAQNRPTIVGNTTDISILDDLKNKSTLLLLVFVLLIMIQSYPMNYILAVSPDTFFSEAGECNLSGVVIKSFVVCIIYYVVTKYLF